MFSPFSSAVLDTDSALNRAGAEAETVGEQVARGAGRNDLLLVVELLVEEAERVVVRGLRDRAGAERIERHATRPRASDRRWRNRRPPSWSQSRRHNHRASRGRRCCHVADPCNRVRSPSDTQLRRRASATNCSRSVLPYW